MTAELSALWQASPFCVSIKGAPAMAAAQPAGVPAGVAAAATTAAT